MKLLLYHFLVLVYYVENNINYYRVSDRIFRDVKDLGDNRLIMITCLCTFWNLILQQIYFVLSFIEDILRLKSGFKGVRRFSAIQQLSSSMFTRYVFPCSLLVCVVFWSLYTLNPRIVDEYNVLATHATPFQNHRMHSFIVVLTLVEICVKRFPYPERAWPEMRATAVYVLAYMLVAALAQTRATVWIYPIINLLRWYQKILVVLVTLLLTCVAYITGQFITYLVWGPSTKQNSKVESGASIRKREN